MLGPVARISNQIARNVMKTPIRNGSHGGIPGENLPFDIYNRKRLTFHFFWFFGVGFAAPYVVLWHQLRKNSNSLLRKKKIDRAVVCRGRGKSNFLTVFRKFCKNLGISQDAWTFGSRFQQFPQECHHQLDQTEPFQWRYPWRKSALRHHQPLQAYRILHSVLRIWPGRPLPDLSPPALEEVR